jgi:hypothetical protein
MHLRNYFDDTGVAPTLLRNYIDVTETISNVSLNHIPEIKLSLQIELL